MVTVIAALVVWAIIQAVCAKNMGPLLVVVVLYALLSMIAEIAY